LKAITRSCIFDSKSQEEPQHPKPPNLKRVPDTKCGDSYNKEIFINTSVTSFSPTSIWEIYFYGTCMCKVQNNALSAHFTNNSEVYQANVNAFSTCNLNVISVDITRFPA